MTMTSQTTRRSVRRFGSAMTGIAVLAVGLAVPTLDRHVVASGPGIEVEHHPSTCPPAHDHSVCVQLGNRLPTPSVHPWEGALGLASLAALPADLGEVVNAPLDEGHPSRASP